MGKVILRKPASDGHIGRPPMDGEDKDNTVMDGFKMTRTLRDRFSTSCEHLGINKSDILREAVEDWLLRYEPKTQASYQKRLAEKRKGKK